MVKREINGMDLGESLSVDELIEKLLRIPTELRALPVVTEGCDCIGVAVNVVIEAGEVLITRNPRDRDTYE